MSPGDDEARPWARDGLNVESSWGLADESMLPPAPRSTLDVDLVTLTAEQRELHLSGYASGYAAGLEAGRRASGYARGFSDGWADRKMAEEAAWRKMADTIRRVTSHSPFSVLCELRGEGDTPRAEAARAFERRWGVAS